MPCRAAACYAPKPPTAVACLRAFWSPYRSPPGAPPAEGGCAPFVPPSPLPPSASPLVNQAAENCPYTLSITPRCMMRRPSPGFEFAAVCCTPLPPPAELLFPGATYLSLSSSAIHSFTGGCMRPFSRPVRSLRSCSRKPLRKARGDSKGRRSRRISARHKAPSAAAHRHDRRRDASHKVNRVRRELSSQSDSNPKQAKWNDEQSCDEVVAHPSRLSHRPLVRRGRARCRCVDRRRRCVEGRRTHSAPRWGEAQMPLDGQELRRLLRTAAELAVGGRNRLEFSLGCGRCALTRAKSLGVACPWKTLTCVRPPFLIWHTAPERLASAVSCMSG